MSKKGICQNDMMLFFLIKLEMMKRHDDFQDFFECREMGTHILLGEVYTSISILIGKLAKLIKLF